MRPNNPLPPSALDAALARFEGIAQRKRADAFAGARLPYSNEDDPVNKITTFPTTDLGTAAKVVVANADLRRSIKWPPKAAGKSLVPDTSGAPQPRPKISKPGIYDMDIELYHTPDLCDGPSVSSSGALLVEQRSLMHFYDEYVNPDREPFEQTAAMILGSAVHHLVLGEPGFAEKFIVRPDVAPDGRAWNGNNLTCKEWLAEQAIAGRRVLTPDQVKTIRGIAANLKKHPQIRDGLLSGAVEQSMIVKDKETGLWLKSRIDVLALSCTSLVDLKTVADASDLGCERMMKDREYNFQLGFGGIVYEQLFDRAPGNSDYNLVLCETSRPWPCTVRPVDITAIGYGRMQVRRALRKIADAFDRDEWPAYDNDLKTLHLPAYREKQLEKELKGGLLLESDAA